MQNNTINIIDKNIIDKNNNNNNNYNNYNIGPINMTYDALLILLSGLLILIILKAKFPNLHYIIYLCIALVYCVNAYNINCMIVGSCNNWAHFIVICNMISAIYFIIKLNNK